MQGSLENSSLQHDSHVICLHIPVEEDETTALPGSEVELKDGGGVGGGPGWQAQVSGPDKRCNLLVCCLLKEGKVK